MDEARGQDALDPGVQSDAGTSRTSELTEPEAVPATAAMRSHEWAAAHQPDATRLAAASSMLLFHASAVLATVALIERSSVHPKIGRPRC